MIDQAYAAAQSIPRFKPNTAYYPSSASVEVIEHGRRVVKGTCNRLQYWRAVGEPTTSTSSQDQMWRAEMGNYISNMLVEWCKRAGTYIADELAFFNEERNISGRVDLVYQHPVSKEIIGVEIKSIGDYYQRQGTVDGDLRKRKPKDSHLLQVILYLDYFKNHPVFPISTFEIPYIARCTGSRHCFVVTLDGSGQALVDGVPTGITTDMIHARFAKLQKHIDSKEVPPRDFTRQYDKETLVHMAKTGQLTKKQSELVLAGRKLAKGDSPCNTWCPFRDKCWEDEIAVEQKKKARRAPKRK